MRTFARSFSCCLLLGLASGVAYGQGGVIFLEGGVPSAPADQPGGKTTMTAVGGTTITISAWVDDVGAGLFNGYDIAFPCTVASDKSGPGPLTWDPNPIGTGSVVVDQTNPDHVFFGMFPPAPGIGGGCPAAPSEPFGGNAFFGPAVTIPNPKYLVEVGYDVPTDAAGTYWVEAACQPGGACPAELSHLLDSLGGTLPGTVFYGVDIVVEQGDCCVGQTCTPTQTQYSCDLLGGTFRVGGDCSLGCECSTDTQCDDSVACTNDACEGVGGTCSDGSAADGQGCCSVANNSKCDDANDCTSDVCDAVNDCVFDNEDAGFACGDASDTDCDNPNTCDGAGGCDANNEPDGPAPTGLCGDGDPCSEDNCLGGVCDHPEIQDCAITMCIEVEDDGARSGIDCVPLGNSIVAKVRLGVSSGLVGAQFRVEYDGTKLELTGFAPGSDCEPGEEFNTLMESAEGVDEDGHAWLFMAVSTGAGTAPCDTDADCGGGTCEGDPSPGDGSADGTCGGDMTSDGGVAGCLYFNQIGGCDNSDVCFCEDLHSKADCNPYITRIVNNQGLQIATQECPKGACTDVSPETPIVIDAPTGLIEADADCEKPTAVVHWDPISVTDECGDVSFDPLVNCVCSGEPWQCEDWLANDGGVFPQDVVWEFWCDVYDTSKCPEEAGFGWAVLVSDQTALDIEIQLSPLFFDAADGIVRGIEFELYEACTPFKIITHTCKDIIFGGAYNLAGHFRGEIKIPKGQYICIAARDSLHTLRASADIVCDSADNGGTGHFSAIFKGQPPQGNWLIGGNLDGNRTNQTGSPHVIDIIDYGIFVAHFLQQQDADTPCEDKEIYDPPAGTGHADINGDGFVDDLDFTFVAINFLQGDKDTCCPPLRSVPVGQTEISVRDLNKMGLAHLAVADLNGDGMVDMDDMQAFMAGQRPKRPGSGR